MDTTQVDQAVATAENVVAQAAPIAQAVAAASGNPAAIAAAAAIPAAIQLLQQLQTAGQMTDSDLAALFSHVGQALQATHDALAAAK